MNTLKSAIFYPMMWLRRPFLMFSKILGGLLFISALVLIFGDHNREGFWKMLIVSSGLSFFLFMLNQVYDQVLLKLNPTNHDLFLRQ